MTTRTTNVVVRDLLSEISSIQFNLKWVSDFGAALDAILSGEFDVCLLDYRLKERDGLEFLQEALSRGVTTPIVFFTAYGSFDLDIEAMSKGAAGWFTKDELSATLLERSIRHAMERQRKREELLKAKRVIQALSECNHAVIHIEDEMDLLRAICRIVVDVGGYKMAWVGYAEDDLDRTVTPVAQYGYDKDYLKTVNVTWRDTERGRGPVGTCIRTGIYSIIRCVDSQAEAAPWREEALKRGYASLIGLPLLLDGRRLGALTIYSSETDAFNTEEVEFLVKLSGNLSYAIGVLRLRKARMQAEESLKEANLDLERRVEERTAELVKVNLELRREAEERRQAEEALQKSGRKFRAIFEQTFQFMGLLTTDGRIIVANSNALKFAGIQESDVRGKPFWETPWWAHSRELQETLRAAVKNAAAGELVRFETTHISAAGNLHAMDFSLKPMTDETGNVAFLIAEARDVTERRQAEEALRLGEKHLSRAEVVARLGNWEFILGSGKVNVSEGAKIIYGLEGSEWSIPQIQEFPLPEYRGMLDKALKELVEEGKPYNVEFKLHRPVDGKIVDIHSIAEYSPEKKVVFGVIQDITERKQAEEALLASETRLRAITDSARDAILMIDQEGMITYWNPAAERILGYTREEAGGRNLHTLLAPERYHAAYHAAFPGFMDTGQGGAVGKTLELVARRKDGKEIPVELSLSAVFMNGWQAVGLLRDITERKQAEEALRASEEKYRELVQNANSIILRMDTSGKVTFFNEFAQRFFGYSEEEMLGNNVVGTIVPEVESSGRDLREMIEDIAKNPDRYTSNINENMLRGGERVWVAWTNKPLMDDDGRVAEVLCIGSDFTERKRTEEALRESEERFSGFFRASPIGTSMLRLTDNQFADGNDAWLGLFGYTREEVIGHTPMELRIWADPEDRVKMVETLQREGGVREYETRFRRKSGEIMDVSVSAEVIELAGARYILGLTHDVTERKRAEEALKESERKFRAIFDQTFQLMALLTIDGRVIEVNKNALQFAQIQESDVIGKPFWETAWWAHSAELQDKLRAAVKKAAAGELVRFEPTHFAADGSLHCMDFSLKPIMDEAGGAAFLIAEARDIDERKRAQEALQRSEREKTILNQIANVFLTIPDDKMYEEVLAVILKALDCRYGVFGYIGDGGELVIPSMTREVWGECQVEGKSIVFPRDLWGDSIWDKAIKEKKSFSSDGPFQTPEGHLPVYNFLTVPVVFMDRTIGLTSVANKDGGFTEEDKAILERIAGTISPILSTRLQRDKQELERKRAEEALRESEARLRQIIDLVPHKIFVKNWDGRYLLANKACAEAYNTSVRELIGQYHAGFHTDESELQNMARDDREVMTKGESKFIAEEPFTDVRGNLRFLQTTKVPFHIPGDNTPAVLGIAIDITNIKRAEAVLRESEARYRLLSENTGDMIWQLDMDTGRFVYVSHAVNRLLGYTPEEAVGQGLEPFHTPESLQYVRKRLPEIVAALEAGDESARVTSHPVDLLCKDGSIVHTEVVVSLLQDDAGRVRTVVGVTRDITEQLHAKEVLRESEARYRLISENTGDVIWQYDLHTDRFVYVSPSVHRLLGYTPEETVGQKMEAFVTPASMQYVNKRLPELVAALSAGDESVRVTAHEVDQVRKDGSVVPTEVVITLLQGAEGRVCALVGVSRDITEKRHAEEALRESETKFRTLFDAMMEGVALHEVVYDERGMAVDYRIVSTNPAFEKHTGLKSEQVLGQLGSKVFGMDKAPHLARYARVASSGQPDSFESYSPSLNRCFDISVTSPKRGCFVIVFENITERKRAEKEHKALEDKLKQAQKLEAIGTLAGGIAHDFNNILQPMMGYTEMALHALSPSNPLRHDLEQVLNASLRAKELVGQILTISRSAQEQQRIPIDISPIIREALKLLRCTLPTSIEIRQNIQMGVALADATQIHQVLMNLCTNAAHAMDSEGVLEVRLSPVELSEGDLAGQSVVDLRPGPYLKLCVSDTGCGIDAKTIERIFDPYFTTKEVGKGSGLGLAVVHGIIKRHGGAISVTSAPGKGSTFCIYVPRIERVAAIPIEMPDEASIGTEHILFLDDEQALVEMGIAMLERFGYRVTAETDSLRAIEIFRARPYDFDLIITDYTMPNLTGMDLAEEIRRIRPDMPIMLCTGFSEKINPDSVKKLGIEFLMKPYGLKQIAETVRRVLDEH